MLPSILRTERRPIIIPIPTSRIRVITTTVILILLLPETILILSPRCPLGASSSGIEVLRATSSARRGAASSALLLPWTGAVGIVGVVVVAGVVVAAGVRSSAGEERGGGDGSAAAVLAGFHFREEVGAVGHRVPGRFAVVVVVGV